MSDKDVVMWGIHAGKTGAANKLFLGESVVALGWDEMKDLSKYKDREDFKKAYAQVWPDAKPMTIANHAGQLYRFVHEMKKEDLVIYPSKMDRDVHIGIIIGDYKYIAAYGEYPNTRKVKWLKSLPRTAFTQGALYEIGSACG